MIRLEQFDQRISSKQEQTAANKTITEAGQRLFVVA